jgi:hypothetical protein
MAKKSKINVRLHMASGSVIEGVHETSAPNLNEVLSELVVMQHAGTPVITMRRKDEPDKGAFFVLTRAVSAFELY